MEWSSAVEMRALDTDDAWCRRGDVDCDGRLVDQIAAMLDMPGRTDRSDEGLTSWRVTDGAGRVVIAGPNLIDLHSVGHKDVLSSCPDSLVELHGVGCRSILRLLVGKPLIRNDMDL